MFVTANKSSWATNIFESCKWPVGHMFETGGLDQL